MKALFFISLFSIGPGMAFAQDTQMRTVEEMHKLHQTPGALVAVLDDPKRDAYQKPHEVITALKLKPGEVIADIGAGSGYFTFRLARHVGNSGRVYAVDVSPEMVMHLNRRIRELNATNVISVLCAPDDPLLADRSVDRFFICDTWHHIADHPKYLAGLKKMLKPGGEIIMIDFRKEKTPAGPPMAMRISREELIQEMQSNGFRVSTEHTFLPYQYFVVFTLD